MTGFGRAHELLADGTVKLRQRLAEYVDDERTAQLSRIPVSP